jgi:hypothetical protein
MVGECTADWSMPSPYLAYFNLMTFVDVASAVSGRATLRRKPGQLGHLKGELVAAPHGDAERRFGTMKSVCRCRPSVSTEVDSSDRDGDGVVSLTIGQVNLLAESATNLALNSQDSRFSAGCAAVSLARGAVDTLGLCRVEFDKPGQHRLGDPNLPPAVEPIVDRSLYSGASNPIGPI